MPTPLLIVGSGGFGRETAAAVAELDDLAVVGFLDDDPEMRDRVVSGHLVLGGTELVHERPEALVVVCTGSPRRYDTRRLIVDRLGLPDERYATIVHPTASVGTGTALGAGSVLLAGVVTTTDVRIGAHVAVMPGTILTHDDVVGDFATFGSGVRLGGSANVGPGAYVGAGSMVREGCNIGAGALLGMGSVLLGDLPADEVWAGSPARFIRGAATAAPATTEAAP